MSALLVSGILLGVSTPVFADEIALTTESGKTTLEITDYTTDPETGLPSDPGAFTLVAVPDIDFGAHSLDSIQPTNQIFTGKYSSDLQVKDTRPTSDSITAAKEAIKKVVPIDGKITQEDINTSKDKWDQAIAASSWRIDAKATELNGIGTSLKIGEIEVLTAGGTILKEDATNPVGTKTYKLDSPSLTIANNNLSVKKYTGTITYTAVNAL